MEYSPLSDLWRILNISPGVTAIFFGVLFVPILVAFLVHRFQPGSILSKSLFASTALVMIGSFGWLMTLGPPAGLSPVGIVFGGFLVLYVPIWILSTLILWALWATLNKSRSAS